MDAVDRRRARVRGCGPARRPGGCAIAVSHKVAAGDRGASRRRAARRGPARGRTAARARPRGVRARPLLRDDRGQRHSPSATCAASVTTCWPRRIRERLARRTRGYGRLGAAYPPPVVQRAVAAEAGHRERIAASLDGFDVLLTPMFTRRPVPVGEWEGRGALWTFNGNARWVPYCAPWNHTGQPAASVPAGLDAGRVPARRAARRAAGRRGAAAVTRRPARGGPRLAGLATADRVSAADLLSLAEEIAREAGGRLLRERFASLGDLEVVDQEHRDRSRVATPTSRPSGASASACAARRPRGRDPRRGGRRRATGTSGLRWVVDPLDGTVNFLFGIPQWAVSIAVEDDAGALAGVVYDPVRDELFAGRRDGAGDARRARAARLRAQRAGDGARGDRLRLRRRRAGRPGRDGGAPAAARARHPPLRRRPRSTSRGAPSAASTPTTSAASTTGTSRPAR